MHEARDTDIIVPTIPNISRKSIEIPQIPDVVALNNYGMFAKNDSPPDHAPPPLTDEQLKMAHQNGDKFEGVFIGEQLIGFSWTLPRTDSYYVNVLSVHPDFRDLGIGTDFLKIADEKALKEGFLKCSLAVDPWNSRGIHTYLKHGYKIVDFKNCYYGEDYPQSQRFLMEKDLSPKNDHFSEHVGVRVNDSNGLMEVLGNGFVGTDLQRSTTADFRKNVVIFQK